VGGFFCGGVEGSVGGGKGFLGEGEGGGGGGGAVQFLFPWGWCYLFWSKRIWVSFFSFFG